MGSGADDSADSSAASVCEVVAEEPLSSAAVSDAAGALGLPAADVCSEVTIETIGDAGAVATSTSLGLPATAVCSEVTIDTAGETVSAGVKGEVFVLSDIVVCSVVTSEIAGDGAATLAGLDSEDDASVSPTAAAVGTEAKAGAAGAAAVVDEAAGAVVVVAIGEAVGAAVGTTIDEAVGAAVGVAASISFAAANFFWRINWAITAIATIKEARKPKKCCGITVFTSSGRPLQALVAESGKA